MANEKDPAVVKHAALGRQDTFTYNPYHVMIDPEAQPRTGPMDENHLAWLTESIREHGQQDPIQVRRDPNGNPLLMSGFYRLAACRRLYDEQGDDTPPEDRFPVRIKFQNANETKGYILNIVSNIVRKAMNPVDMANGISKMMDVYGLSVEEIAAKLNRSTAWVEEQQKIVELPSDLQKNIVENVISVDVAKKLAVEPKAKRQELIAAAVADTTATKEKAAKKKEEKSAKDKPKGTVPAAVAAPPPAKEKAAPAKKRAQVTLGAIAKQKARAGETGVAPTLAVVKRILKNKGDLWVKSDNLLAYLNGQITAETFETRFKSNNANKVQNADVKKLGQK